MDGDLLRLNMGEKAANTPHTRQILPVTECPTCHSAVEDIGFCTECGEVWATVGHCGYDGIATYGTRIL